MRVGAGWRKGRATGRDEPAHGLLGYELQGEVGYQLANASRFSGKALSQVNFDQSPVEGLKDLSCNARRVLRCEA